ncbi:MAG TPA: condensation domain-containing protein, partial [Herpetosiphonaceae bacterium]
WPLSVGAQLVLVPAETRADSAALVRTLAAQRISVFGASPSQHAVLLAEPGIAACTSLRYVVSGGEPLSDEVYQRFVSRLRATLCNCYGPTEATIDTTFWVGAPGDAAARPRIGRPLPNVQVYVLDRRMEPVPVGVVGELYVGGAGLARGYHQRPALTAARFVPHPFSHTPGQRLYRTGDLVRYQADGQLDFVGRNDEQVKLRGFRIELGEIEAALRAHDAVRDALVLLRDERLVAYVVGENLEPRTQNLEGEPDGSRFLVLSSDFLRTFLAERLPEYMVPSAIVVLDAWPLTANGKIDRAALPEPAWRAAPEVEAVLPRTPIEGVIANVWRSVLGVERVGVYDNFFALGGHSLLATQVVSRLRQILQVEIPLRLLFEAPTIDSLTTCLAGQPAAAALPLVPVPRDDRPLPLSFAQQRLWFLDRLQPGSSAYHVPLVVRLHGHIDRIALQRSLSAIVERHEVLRTTVAQPGTAPDEQPIQVILPAALVPLPVVDVSDLPEATVNALVQSEVQQPFDLQSGPLLRARLLRCSAREHVLVLLLHHIVTDGWSQSVLLRELIALYRGFAGGAAVDLPALPIQYADYALWQRQLLQGDLLERQLGYWRAQLADVAPLDLPTDYPRPPIATTRGAHTSFELSAALTSDLHRVSQQHGATLFMTLLAAFKVLLSRYSGQDDIVVGTPIAGRVRPELEDLIGFFVNTLVLRTDLAGQPSFAELVARVRTTALDAYAHQDLPFELIVEQLQPERDLSRSPLFQVLFALQNTPSATIDLDDLTLEPVVADWISAKFDLTLTLSETAQGLVGGFEYRTDLFAAATIERMATHFQTLLAALVADPQQPIDRLPLLTAAERRRLLHAWNATTLAYPTDGGLAERVAAQARHTPDAIAVICGDATLSYAQLNAQANQLAHHLQALGVGPEVRVGIALAPSL